MHAFVSGVLLRMSGFDEFGRDAELYPPDGQLREASECGRSERCSVVGANAKRQAVLFEQSFEGSFGRDNEVSLEALACEEEPGV